MTEEELALYEITRFYLGEIVEIEETGIRGVIEGKQILINREDEYLVNYWDISGNPQRIWWPDSSLELADDAPPQSNIIPFPASRIVRHPGNSTRH